MKKTKGRKKYEIPLFRVSVCRGGFVYQMIEMAWRSRTHWSMFILGGACFLSVNLLRLTVLKDCNLFLFCLIGGLCVTVLEFITGCIVNLRFGLGVWDYSSVPFNLLGQVCLPFSIGWSMLTLPGLWMGRVLCDVVGVNSALRDVFGTSCEGKIKCPSRKN